MQTDMKKYKKGGIFIHLNSEELEKYEQLPDSKKRLIKTIIKTLILNPDLLSENLVKYAVLKNITDYVCPLCLMPFSSHNALMHHFRYTNHEPRCIYCGKSFVDQEALVDHVCKKHNICLK